MAGYWTPLGFFFGWTSLPASLVELFDLLLNYRRLFHVISSTVFRGSPFLPSLLPHLSHSDSLLLIRKFWYFIHLKFKKTLMVRSECLVLVNSPLLAVSKLSSNSCILGNGKSNDCTKYLTFTQKKCWLRSTVCARCCSDSAASPKNWKWQPIVKFWHS